MHNLASTSHTKRLQVRAPEGSYEIVLGNGLLGQIGTLAAQLAPVLGRKVVVASDDTVLPIYGDAVITSLRTAGFEPSTVVMPAGEQHKSMPSVDLFVEAFLDANLDRSGWVLAMGGGVVGDTAGFAASIYMRGVSLVQVPTTLLAMADSSVGGKVGVDHQRGKNLLGAFKQPRMVIADLDVLATLPQDQFACGMAEIIKAGVIADPTLFSLIEQSAPDDLNYRDALLRALAVKRDIVERDPYEAGARALLNLGHTFGHAFERCSGYTRLHGFAVSQGMVVAARVAGTLGFCTPSIEERLRGVLVKCGLPVRWGAPHLTGRETVDAVWEAMLVDKKRRDGVLSLVLPEAIGKVRLVAGVPEDVVKRVLRETQ